MKERIIYNNYDLWETYEESARELLADEYDETDPSESELWDEICFSDQVNWEYEHDELKSFFEKHDHFLLMGTVGRWNGTFAAGKVFDDFDKMLSAATKDCDYIKIWDENGHLYLQCSHHDGTNSFEIKFINQRGYEMIDDWSYDYDDKRTEAQVHTAVFQSNFYSSLPHFAHKVYGVPKRQGR